MLALSIAVAALSDLTAVGQPGAAPEAENGFLALLNAGNNNGNDIWPDNNDSINNNSSDQAAANNPVTPPANVPTSIFATNNYGQQNTQNTDAPAPPPQQPSQQNTAPSADSANNNDTQNTNTSPSPSQAVSTPPSNAGGQNTTLPTSGQSSAPVTTNQATGGNVTPPAKQPRAQIQNQLGDISQILAGIIQALSATTTQPAQTSTTPAATTSSPQIAGAGNTATDPAANGQAGTGSQTDQEISLLKDMQSLLQQMQQSLPGQGQNNQDTLQTLSDSLLSDMTKLSQLMGQPPTGSDIDTTNSLANATSLGELGNLLKNSIAQAQNQLQALQSNNETIFAQAKSDLQTPSIEISGQPKTTQNNNSASTNTTPAASNIPVAPIAQDAIIKPVIDNLPFNAPPLAQANVSQDGGNSAGSGSQDSGQNQIAQPVIAAASSSASPDASGSSSFARILNQVSQSDVLDQVQFQVKTALSDGSSKISIQLNPPELGKVDVKLDVSADGKTNGITITADNQGTLNLLKQDTQGLTDALKAAGLSTDSGSLNFSLGGGQQNQTQDNQQAATTYQQAQPEEETPAINAISRSYVVNLAEGLDITI